MRPKSSRIFLALIFCIFLASPVSSQPLNSDRTQATNSATCELLAIKEIEKDFAVKIARRGEFFTEYFGSEAGQQFEARDPDISELAAVRFAFSRSQPLKGNNSVAPLTLLFLKHTCQCNRSAAWINDKHYGQMIWIEPGYAKSNIPLSNIILHELAHREMFQMGIVKGSTCHTKLAKQLGWQKYFNEQTGETGWMIKSKENDHYFYKITRYSSRWVRCNVHGQALDEEGRTLTNSSQAFYPDDETVASLASIKPATDYFDDPQEMLAEALMLYRAGTQTREKLKSNCPELHKIVGSLARQEQNEAHGDSERFAAENTNIASRCTK